MPDITMCANKNCALRSMCYRYRAVPDQYQAYAVFEPKKMVVACDSFWNCKGYKLRDTEEVDAQETVFDVPHHGHLNRRFFVHLEVRFFVSVMRGLFYPRLPILHSSYKGYELAN